MGGGGSVSTGRSGVEGILFLSLFASFLDELFDFKLALLGLRTSQEGT